MVYITKKCTNCGYVIQNHEVDTNGSSLDIGYPFEECPNCKKYLVNPKRKEINMLTTKDWIVIIFRNAISGLMLCGIIGVLLALLSSKLFNLTDDQSITTWIILTVIICILYFKKIIDSYKIKIHESNERLKDKKYAKLINDIIKK